MRALSAVPCHQHLTCWGESASAGAGAGGQVTQPAADASGGLIHGLLRAPGGQHAAGDRGRHGCRRRQPRGPHPQLLPGRMTKRLHCAIFDARFLFVRMVVTCETLLPMASAWWATRPAAAKSAICVKALDGSAAEHIWHHIAHVLAAAGQSNGQHGWDHRLGMPHS